MGYKMLMVSLYQLFELKYYYVQSQKSSDIFFMCLSPGRSVADYTSLKFFLSQVPYLSWLSAVVPSFLHLPRFVLTLAYGRFWAFVSTEVSASVVVMSVVSDEIHYWWLKQFELTRTFLKEYCFCYRKYTSISPWVLNEGHSMKLEVKEVIMKDAPAYFLYLTLALI